MAMPSERDHDRRGLLRLMIKMPALRGMLQILSATDPHLLGLCGAYEDANVALDRLRKEKGNANRDAIAEYEELCTELETDIIRMCQ
ncbi:MULTISPECIES: hypothetical protein [unclassified Mesorhizobium]|uniref:hypothetical protein n=1 Tax=unclassified Mesorhizobium TaxID=325217 RepID=UPI00112CEAC6|nr:MULTISPECIES: hypothetical protein [unclassified Mesorhizobium]TPM94831.1 hypothetical protein FJ977_22390 [Mesorhizobium sp. B2-1-3A]